MSERFLDAVRRGDLVTARAMIDKDRDLVRTVLRAGTESPEAGSTPLHVAAREGQAGMIRLLVRHGADLEARTEEGRTALHDAIEHAQPGAQKALLDAGAELDICAAAILGRLEDLRAMLDRDPEQVNDRSTSLSPLGWAAFGNQVEVAKELLERGARMDDGELSCAALVGHAEVAEVLLAHGADPNAIEPRPGTNALHAAAELRYTDDATRFVQLMLQAGADPAIRSRDGRTALDIAEAGARAQASFGDGDRPLRNFSGVIGLLRAAAG